MGIPPMFMFKILFGQMPSNLLIDKGEHFTRRIVMVVVVPKKYFHVSTLAENPCEIKYIKSFVEHLVNKAKMRTI